MSRAAIAILSTENLINNLKIVQDKAFNSKIIAMVKANAYGHGIRSTALRIEKYIYSFGVASIDEAQILRKIGIRIPITLMEGVFSQNELLISAYENFHVVFHEENQIDWIKNINLPNKISAWIKIDTGMGRIGFAMDIAKDMYNELLKNNNISSLSVMSHLACAEDIDHILNYKQLDKFTKFNENVISEKSICNSAAIFNFPEHHYEYVRPGIALYGISPIDNISAKYMGLKPVMTLKTKIIAIKEHKEGTSIGYNAKYICQKDIIVGVIAMGYGDGYPRTAVPKIPVIINDIRCEIIGQVSMDMMSVDLTNCPNAQVGDDVILWGEGLAIEEIAKFVDRSPYELLCNMQHRVKFCWIG